MLNPGTDNAMIAKRTAIHCGRVGGMPVYIEKVPLDLARDEGPKWLMQCGTGEKTCRRVIVTETMLEAMHNRSITPIDVADWAIITFRGILGRTLHWEQYPIIFGNENTVYDPQHLGRND
jgi:hypothetical protein